VLVEIWGSGHLDGLVLLPVVAATSLAIAGRPALAAVLLGLGTLVKLYAGVLLFVLLEGAVVWPLAAFALVVLLGYAPVAHLGLGSLGSLGQYVATEYFNPGLVRTVVDVPAVTLVALGAWVVAAALWRRGSSVVDRARVLIAGFVILSPNVFPWYVVWLVPFLAVRPSAPWIAFTGTVALAYTFFLYEPWRIPVWARVGEILPLVLVLGPLLARRWIANPDAPPACLTSRPPRGGLP
jgi:hypothetical protein